MRKSGAFFAPISIALATQTRLAKSMVSDPDGAATRRFRVTVPDGSGKRVDQSTAETEAYPSRAVMGKIGDTPWALAERDDQPDKHVLQVDNDQHASLESRLRRSCRIGSHLVVISRRCRRIKR